uniref:Uncharacterized protein n=1 Tax=Arundo donax TaxID=35708 RepID=A0A0A9E1D0_ARUDO
MFQLYKLHVPFIKITLKRTAISKYVTCNKKTYSLHFQ